MGCFQRVPPDQTDYPPRPMRPSCWDIFCLCWSILFHIVDLGTDIKVACYYYINGEIYYFFATVIIIVIPSIVTSCVSYRMYKMDMESEVSYKWTHKRKLQLLMLVLQLAPVLRYVDSLKYACKSRKAEKQKNKEEQERYFKLMLKEDADVALLRVFECFLESAPQQVLQISYILKLILSNETVDSGITGYDPYISAGSSFVGMALCLMTYQRNIRYVQEDKDNISCVGSALIFLWHFFVTISRIFMLSAMVYISAQFSLLAVVLHWFCMIQALSLIESHMFCTSTSAIHFENSGISSKVGNLLFSAVLGLVYIFTYITPGEGGTCCRYTCFYVICFLENIVGAFIISYYLSGYLRIALAVVCVVPFVCGCLFMVIYHWKFHPKHYIPPSIIPPRRKTQAPEGTHLSETPSPKAQAETNATLNGSITREFGQGDDDEHTNLNGSSTVKL